MSDLWDAIAKPHVAALTQSDIDRALASPEHFGFGYAQVHKTNREIADQVDEVVVRVANELSLSYEDFFIWLNSKNGRWLSDGLTWPEAAADIEGSVRGVFNQQVMDELLAEENPGQPWDFRAGSKTAAQKAKCGNCGAITTRDHDWGDPIEELPCDECGALELTKIGNRRTASEKLDAIWEKMNDSEKFGVQFGMFPAWVDPDQNSLSHEEIVELMGMAAGTPRSGSRRTAFDMNTTNADLVTQMIDDYQSGGGYDNLEASLEELKRRGFGLADDALYHCHSPSGSLSALWELLGQIAESVGVDRVVEFVAYGSRKTADIAPGQCQACGGQNPPDAAVCAFCGESEFIGPDTPERVYQQGYWQGQMVGEQGVGWDEWQSGGYHLPPGAGWLGDPSDPLKAEFNRGEREGLEDALRQLNLNDPTPRYPARASRRKTAERGVREVEVGGEGTYGFVLEQSEYGYNIFQLKAAPWSKLYGPREVIHQLVSTDDNPAYTQFDAWVDNWIAEKSATNPDVFDRTKSASKQAGRRGDLDPSVAFSILLEVMPGFAEMDLNDPSDPVKELLDAWYASDSKNMYDFALEWVGSRTAQKKVGVKWPHDIFTCPSCGYATDDTWTAGVINDMESSCPECGTELIPGDERAWCNLQHGDCGWYTQDVETTSRKKAEVDSVGNAYGTVDVGALNPAEWDLLVNSGLAWEFTYTDSPYKDVFTIQSVADEFVNVTGDYFNGTLGIPIRRIKGMNWYGSDYMDIIKILPDVKGRHEGRVNDQGEGQQPKPISAYQDILDDVSVWDEV